uniref:Structural maintenance of chromosomes 6 smc6 n=3 Tax=Rhizophora mucronata TaxID=61149 RepID=A0A2P2KQB0_RHIMU
MKNEGDEAFKPHIYGGAIIIERRITQSANSTTLKNCRGRKVASRKDELRELVEHYNIDVENPCVIMSQDKSREFLHSGNDRDKFKFFYKATLLQQVNDLLQSIDEQLRSANVLVDELEASIKPIERELVQLQGKIKNMEHIEEISQQVQLLKKKLAWSWVYDVDKQLQELSARIEKLRDRIPKCQDKIDWNLHKVESLTDCFMKKKAQIAQMVQKTSEMRKEEDQLKHSLEVAKKEKLELEERHGRQTNQVLNMMKRVRSLEQQVQDVQEQHVKNTQAEESEMEEKLNELQHVIDVANSTISRLKGDESALSDRVSKRVNEMSKLIEEVHSYVKKDKDIRSQILELRQNSSNKVMAFGGDRVTQLLKVIERYHQRFQRPPIGPIGVHVSLVGGDKWALALENAIGRLLNAFIVTSHKDSLLLRSCAAQAEYGNLQIIIYDFSRPRLAIPSHMLPQTSHPTTLSVVKSDDDTVLNVLVDMGNAERQVLVEDYDSGKAVAFDRRVSNLKEVFTLEGYRM